MKLKNKSSGQITEVQFVGGATFFGPDQHGTWINFDTYNWEEVKESNEDGSSSVRAILGQDIRVLNVEFK